MDVNPFPGEFGQFVFRVAVVRWQRRADIAVIGESLQSALRHCVRSEGAASDLMYRASEAFGSLVPVFAHSRRWARAPAL